MVSHGDAKSLWNNAGLETLVCQIPFLLRNPTRDLEPIEKQVASSLFRHETYTTYQNGKLKVGLLTKPITIKNENLYCRARARLLFNSSVLKLGYIHKQCFFFQRPPTLRWKFLILLPLKVFLLLRVESRDGWIYLTTLDNRHSLHLLWVQEFDNNS